MRSPRILVVEDHPINRRLLQAQLAAEGWQSEVAATGAEALLWLARRHADNHMLPLAVVTDYVLDDMTGVELLRRVREWEAGLAAAANGTINQSDSVAGHSPLPMILYSGMPLDHLKSQARGLDCLAVITKPITRSQLREALAPLCAAGHSFRQAECREHASAVADPYCFSDAPITAMPHDLLVELLQFGDGELTRLRTSISTGALDQAATIAHGLRGAAAVLQFLQIAQVASGIEAQSRLGLSADLGPACERLQYELDHLRRHVAEAARAPNSR